MALPWIRLDTAMPDNPKLLDLLRERDGHRAAFVWICCLSYSGKHGLDGFIPRNAGPFVHGKSSDFTRLCAANLLVEVAGGWEIPGWGEFQESSEDTQKRSERARQAARARWSKDEVSQRRKGKEASG